MNRIPLLQEVRACTLCQADLPAGPRPILQLHPDARLLIASQAPGRRAHASGIPFDDASGDRLREWLGLSREAFYDERRVAILPMGLCYPGKGKGGDLPPRRECAATWRAPLLALLPRLELTLVIGQYAQAWHLPVRGATLTDTVRDYAARVRAAQGQADRSRAEQGQVKAARASDVQGGLEQGATAQGPTLWPLPHPSPLNNLWLRRNPWFGQEVLPLLRQRVRAVLDRK